MSTNKYITSDGAGPMDSQSYVQSDCRLGVRIRTLEATTQRGVYAQRGLLLALPCGEGSSASGRATARWPARGSTQSNTIEVYPYYDATRGAIRIRGPQPANTPCGGGSAGWDVSCSYGPTYGS